MSDDRSGMAKAIDRMFPTAADSPLVSAFMNAKPVPGVMFDCDECGVVSYHRDGCAVDAKRKAMQEKLAGVAIDTTKLKDRSPPRRTVEVVAHDIRRKLLERAEQLLDANDLDNAVALINAAKGLV